MEGIRVASRYAKSFIELAMEQGVLEQAYNDMKVILEICKTNHDFAVFLKSPVVKTDKKQAVLKQIFSGKLNKVSEDFVQLIASHKSKLTLLETTKQ